MLCHSVVCVFFDLLQLKWCCFVGFLNADNILRMKKMVGSVQGKIGYD